MKYPIGIQDFESLRADGYPYVDKTRQIYCLAQQGRYYFLSRPRRFGKSLLLSTMKAYFLGKRELFRGLAIENLETEWKQYPVLYMDINSGNYSIRGNLDKVLNDNLSLWEQKYGTSPSETTPELRFMGVVRRAAQKAGERVVILIDEYDKPMLQSIDDEPLLAEHRNTLKAFYSVFKTCDQYIKFAFLTGVTKFSKVSVFSDLNNLNDISMNSKYADICGITDKELRANFNESIKALAKAQKMPKKLCLEKLRQYYDGYHFTQESPGIYNPFSVLSAFDSLRFDGFWFATGTPTFLVKLLQHSNFELDNLTSRPVPKESLEGLEQMWRNPIPVIYQSGYLTIKSYDPDSDLYTLDYPNEEVKGGFFRFLLSYYTPRESSDGFFYIEEFRKDLYRGDVDGFLSKLKAFFDSGDYRVAGDAEKYFQNSMCVVIRLLGLRVETEMATSRGRIDITIQTPDYIYLVELKLDGSASEALRQISDKGYASKFAGETRQLFRIGISFSSNTRSIEEYRVEF